MVNEKVLNNVFCKNCIMVGTSCFMTCIAGLPLCFIIVLLCSVMLNLELLLTPNLALKI